MARNLNLNVIFRVVDKASRPLSRINSQFGAIGGAAGIGGFSKIGAGLAIAGAAMTAFSVAGIKTAGSFADSMNFIEGVTETTTKGVSKFIRNLARDTRFTTSEYAEAFKQVALTGLKNKESMAAVTGAAKLALAAQEDVGKVTGSLVGIMKAFGKEINKANVGEFGNQLAVAFTTTRATLPFLAQGFKRLGPVAKQMGISFAESSAALGLLADSGIEASIAGTGLRRVLFSIAPIAKKQRNIIKALGLDFFQTKDGKTTTKSLAGIVKEFEKLKTRFKLSDPQLGMVAKALFGLRGGPIFLALMGKTSKAIDAQTKRILAHNDKLTSMQQIMQRGTGFALKRVASTFEELGLAVFGADSVIGQFTTDTLMGLADLIKASSEFSAEFLKPENFKSKTDGFLSIFTEFNKKIISGNENLIKSVASLDAIVNKQGFLTAGRALLSGRVNQLGRAILTGDVAETRRITEALNREQLQRQGGPGVKQSSFEQAGIQMGEMMARTFIDNTLNAAPREERKVNVYINGFFIPPGVDTGVIVETE